MNRVVVFLLLFLLLAQQTVGQQKSLLNKSFAQRYTEVGKIYVRAISNADSSIAFREANALKKLALRYQDKDLELEMDLLKAYYLTVWHKKERAAIEHRIRELSKDAAAARDLQIQARAAKVLGDYYWFTLNNYELAFETYVTLEQLLRKISSRDLPDKVYHLQNMAQAYHNFSDYKKALQLFHQIIHLEADIDPRGSFNSALYSIGKIYQQQKLLDSSDYYYRRIIENPKSVNYVTWQAIAKGGLGQNYYLRGDYDRAVPYLQAAIDQALKAGDFGLAAGSLITLADVFLKKNDFQKAEHLALLARKCLSKAEPDRYKHFQDLYPVLSKLYSAKGVTALIGPYLDSAIFAKDSITRQFNAMQMMRGRQKNELQKHRAEMQKADAEKRLKTAERNMLIFVVVLLVIASAYFIYSQRQRHREQQRQLAREVKAKEEELNNATHQLSEFARNISEKTKLIEQLEHQRGVTADADILNQLRQSTILTADEWEYFKKLFEKVHTGYLSRIRQTFPDLTQSEIRFIALIKLGLGYQEMASILGVSNHAVRTTKYRLLKKIDLPEDKSLEEILATI